jgi:hypothetical protein
MSCLCTVRIIKPLRTKKNSTPAALPNENGIENALNPKYFSAAIVSPRWKRTTNIAAIALPACSDLYTVLLLLCPTFKLISFEADIFLGVPVHRLHAANFTPVRLMASRCLTR